MQVKKNTVVSLHYVMKNGLGEIMEDNSRAAAVEYVHGSGKLLPALEAAVTGLRPGDKKIFSLAEEQLQAEFIFEVTINDIRLASTEEIEKGVPDKKAGDSECRPGCCC